MLALFSQYINSNPLVCFATDIGSWEMSITDTEGKSLNFKGSLSGRLTVGDIDLTYYLRKQIPIDNLFVSEDIFMEPDEE